MTAAAPSPIDGNGEYNSLVLDASGNPVISHYAENDPFFDPALPGDLLLTHCDDPACAPGGDVTNTVDSIGNVGLYTSLALDGAGNPVISYFDETNGNLKVAHCNDANCAAGGDAINTADSSASVVGLYTSLALDGSGNPVISYHDSTAGNLKLIHCNDVNCAGANESTATVDGSPDVVGLFTSLELFSGNPTVSYYDQTNAVVNVARCNDANCAVGGDTIKPVATTPGIVQQHASLALDASGNPVVSFLSDLGMVAVAHCSDAACNTLPTPVELPDPNGGVLEPVYTSIVLASGIPVVSYWDPIADVLRVGRCLDAACNSVSVSTADNVGGSTGAFSSIALDSAGNPIIASYDDVFNDLVVTRCVEPFCNPRRIRSLNG